MPWVCLGQCKPIQEPLGPKIQSLDRAQLKPVVLHPDPHSLQILGIRPSQHHLICQGWRYITGYYQHTDDISPQQWVPQQSPIYVKKDRNKALSPVALHIVGAEDRNSPPQSSLTGVSLKKGSESTQHSIAHPQFSELSQKDTMANGIEKNQVVK